MGPCRAGNLGASAFPLHKLWARGASRELALPSHPLNGQSSCLYAASRCAVAPNWLLALLPLHGYGALQPGSAA